MPKALYYLPKALIQKLIKYYDKALAVNPNYIYALSDKGDALSSQGNYSEALKYA